MRVAIVLSSTIVKYGRWDVGFYLEDPDLSRQEERAKTRVKQSVNSLRKVRKQIKENLSKVREMRESGEVMDL